MLMANNLIFKSNDIEVITKKYNSVNNKFNIIQKITMYCDLEIIKNLLDENTIKKNIYTIFNQICKRNNNDLTNFFYYKFENIINEKIENVFKMLCISKNKELIEFYCNNNIVTPNVLESSFLSLIRMNYSLEEINKDTYLDIAKWLYYKYEEIRKIEISSNQILEWSCDHNNLLLLEWLFPIYHNNLEKFDATKYFLIACEKNLLDIMIWLYKNESIIIDLHSTNSNFDNDAALFLACKNGNLKILEWLYNLNCYDFHRGTDIFSEDALFIYASKYNHIEICKWLFYTVKNININVYNDISFSNLCYFGNFENIMWLYSKNKIDIFNRYNLALKNACESKNNKLIRWFYNKLLCCDKYKFCYGINIIKHFSARSNNLSILKWLYNITKLDNNFYDEELLFSACENGNLEILKWIFSKFNKDTIEISCKSYYCLTIIPYKKLTKFLDFLTTYYQIPSYIFNKLLEFSCKKDSTDLLNWIDKREKESKDINFTRLLIISTSLDKINVVKWLLKKRIFKNYIIKTIFRFAIIAASIKTVKFMNKLEYNYTVTEDDIYNGLSCNNLEFNQWLIKSKYFVKMNDSNLFKLIIVVLENQNLKLFEWIYNNLIPKSISYSESMLIMSCLIGNLEIVKFIYSKNIDINFSIMSHTPFYNSLFTNNLEISLWIQAMTNFDVSSYDNYAIKIACENGNLEMVQWLLSFDSVDVHVDNDYPFLASCISGNLLLCKYLHEKYKINIKANNDEAFRKSCEKKNIDVCKWLSSLDDRYILELNDNIQDNIKITNWYIKNIYYDLYQSGEYDKILYKLGFKIDENNNDFKDENCIICYNSSDIKTSCNHFFCKECLLRLLIIYNEKKCPYCRQEIDEKNSYTK